jgi:pentatricopeptide repeat protein
MKRALSLLQQLQARGLAPDSISYNLAIQSCTKSGQYEQALQLLEEMELKFGIKPTVVTYQFALAACKV